MQSGDVASNSGNKRSKPHQRDPVDAAAASTSELQAGNGLRPPPGLSQTQNTAATPTAPRQRTRVPAAAAAAAVAVDVMALLTRVRGRSVTVDVDVRSVELVEPFRPDISPEPSLMIGLKDDCAHDIMVC